MSKQAEIAKLDTPHHALCTEIFRNYSQSVLRGAPAVL